MAYTLPPIAVTGEIITAAWGNDVRNALAVLKTGLTSDVGSYRATLNGTAAVDTGIARPALVNSNGRDEWGMVNFGDYTSLVPYTAAFTHRTLDNPRYTAIPQPGNPVFTGRSANNYFGNDAIYIGHTLTFDGVEIVLARASDGAIRGNLRNGGLDADYWNGSGWRNLTGVTDGTAAADRHTLTRDGLIDWTIPSDWQQNAVNGVTHYWVRFRFPWVGSGHGDNLRLQNTDIDQMLISAPGTTGGLGRDAEWPIIRLNDLHDATVCPAVSAGDVLDRSNSMVFADAVADGEDAYLAVLSNGNLAIAVGATGVHALPFSIKTLSANRLA